MGCLMYPYVDATAIKHMTTATNESDTEEHHDSDECLPP